MSPRLSAAFAVARYRNTALALKRARGDLDKLLRLAEVETAFVLPRGKEHEPDGMVARLRQRGASLGELVGEQRVGNLRRHPRAVPGPAVRVHCSAVRHARERLQRERKDFRARASPPVGHEADVARVVLEGRIVEPCPSFASFPVIQGRRLSFRGAWREGSYK